MQTCQIVDSNISFSKPLLLPTHKLNWPCSLITVDVTFSIWRTLKEPSLFRSYPCISIHETLKIFSFEINYSCSWYCYHKSYHSHECITIHLILSLVFADSRRDFRSQFLTIIKKSAESKRSLLWQRRNGSGLGISPTAKRFFRHLGSVPGPDLSRAKSGQWCGTQEWWEFGQLGPFLLPDRKTPPRC